MTDMKNKQGAMKGGSRMRKPFMALLFILALLIPGAALAGETRIPPSYPVPEYVTWLLDTAVGEVGYREGDHGYTKYGEWAGDPYCQWCAEFLCWCVDQVDQQHGTSLLNSVFPRYSGSNTGRSWFIQQGRFLVRWGNLEDWGYQWLKGEDQFLTTGDYIPQPGDWVFFTWTSDLNTDHVAIVEYCTRDDEGNVKIHCIEGNTPVSVKRATYDLTYSRILGYGTVHDVCDWTIRGGNSGQKVLQLQQKLIRLGYLDPGSADGVYGGATAQAIRDFQARNDLKVNGIANITTQTLIDQYIRFDALYSPESWAVIDATADDEFTLDSRWDLDALFSTPADDRKDEPEEIPSLGEEPDENEEEETLPTDLIEDELPDWIEEVSQ